MATATLIMGANVNDPAAMAALCDIADDFAKEQMTDSTGFVRIIRMDSKPMPSDIQARIAQLMRQGEVSTTATKHRK